MLKEPPDTIYLLDMGDEWAWCDTPEPDNDDRRPIKYVRVRSKLPTKESGK